MHIRVRQIRLSARYQCPSSLAHVAKIRIRKRAKTSLSVSERDGVPENQTKGQTLGMGSIKSEHVGCVLSIGAIDACMRPAWI